MRKLFLLIPALVLSLAMSADPIGPNDPNVTVNNVIADAVAAASANAIIELSDGIYKEDGGFILNKNITIKAAEGAHPIIAQRYYIYFNNSAKVTFKGIKFDGGAYGDVGAYDHALRTYGTTVGDETLTLDDCEFSNYPSYVIYIQRANRCLDAITITNCYFHNNVRSAVYIGTESGDAKQSCNSLTIENSTFAAVSEDYPVITYYAPDAEHTTALNVNHCTFYNHPNRAIYWRQSPNLAVSNCIFAQPASSSYKSVDCVGGTITNCLTYNTGGYSSAATQQGCLTGNPYFVNTVAGNYDFTPASFSPAHNAGTEDQNLGDLNWISDDSAHPTTMNITADDANSLTAAVKTAWSGDTIVLANGTYSEAEVIVFDKSLVIKAAAEANPVIAQHYYSKVTSGADVQFIGIKFDGSIYPANDYCFYPFDNTAGNELHFEKCEFVGFNNYVLYNGGAYSLDSLIVNNCFFHNNTKSSVIYFEKHASAGSQTVKGVKITNSTFANNNTSPSYSVIFVRNQTGTTVSDVEVTVDHCTFYNNTTQDYDHSAVRSYKSTKVNVTNCIFAHPEPVNLPATSCYGGTVSNNLTYNLNYYDYRYGHRQDGGQPVLSNNIAGNPVFADPANNDFTLLNASSARRQNGDVYGDPRWITAIQTIAIPDTLLPIDAILSDSASVIQGTPDSITFKYVGSKKYNGLEYAKWKVTVDKTGFYNFTANTYRVDGQKYEIALLNDEETSTLIINDNGGNGIGSGNASISTGNIALEAGNTYTVRVRNIYEYADGVLLNVVAAYEGGAIIAIPDTLRAIDALKSQYAFVNEAGELRFTDDSHDGHVREQYGKWNISVAKAGDYKFTVSANSDNAHAYELTLRNSTETSDIASKALKGSSQTPLKFALNVENLAIGNYVLNIRDTTNYSHGRIEYIAASYEGGAVVNAPSEILAADAVLLKEDGGTLKMIHRANGDIEYKSNEQNLTEYALWNLHATEAGEMVITVNSPSGGHTLRFELYEGTTLKSSAEEEDATKWEHNYSLTQHLNIPAAGDYTLKLINKQQYSIGVIHSITIAPYVAPAGITMSEEDANSDAWADKLNGDAVNITLTRTIIAGMYNTLCLPFPVSSTQCKAIFGNDVELLTMHDATLSGDILTITFDNANDIYQGTPILIKTSNNIVNPTFEGVTIKCLTPSATNGDAAEFIGTFFPTSLVADRDLFVGQNNKVHFPSNSNPLKGLRAYFHVTAASAQAIKRARIVTREEVITEIDLVNGENNGVIKTIENGQLIINLDGIRFNIMGTKIQ